MTRIDATTAPNESDPESQAREGLSFRALGPGLLFAAAAVGVSHLVQSTRAGAVYGLAMFIPILLANAAKYPAFRFGPHYTAATGTSLLQGYRSQGVWALCLYALLTLGTMFTVLAAVTFVTAGLAIHLLGVSWSPVYVSGGLLALCGTLLFVGHYRWLDRITKVLVGVLTLSTVLAAAIALPAIHWEQESVQLPFSAIDGKTLIFLAALVGWMPSAIDVSVWHSLWGLAKRSDTGHRASIKETTLDFHVGYLGTAFLALCFLVLGTSVMHGGGVEIASGAGAFANQVTSLYASTLGEWSRPLIAVSAFAVMFSTTLAVADGFPRALSVLVARFRGDEEPNGNEENTPLVRRSYWGALMVLCVGAIALLSAFISSLVALVDLATTLSFLTAPVLAILNHRAVLRPEVPLDKRPPRWLMGLSLVGIVAMSVLAAGYLYLRYAVL